MSINRGMDKPNINTYNEKKIFALKIKEILQYAILWMNLKDITLNEISQSQRESDCMISTYVRYLK